jgi:hypothetical protein
VRRCRHCRREAVWPLNDMLRAAGWRIYDGPSLTGKELHLLVCPWCAGTTDAVDPETHWRVGCSSCEWVYDPAEDEERIDRNEPLTKAEAQKLAEDHWCQPSTWIDHPKRERVELKPNNLSLLDLVGAS